MVTRDDSAPLVAPPTSRLPTGTSTFCGSFDGPRVVRFLRRGRSDIGVSGVNPTRQMTAHF